jgi:nucleoside-diphosphate-sugar epimerase
MVEKKKVFITGLSSSLLQKVAGFLPSDEYRIIGLTRKDDPPELENVVWVKGELENPDSYEGFLHGVRYIIHGAALTHSFTEEAYFELNLEATKRLVNAAISHEVSHFVFISSRAAVPNSGGYGESKLAAEKYIQEHMPSWLFFKPGEIFGGIKSEGIESLINDAIHKKFVVYPGGESKMYPVSLVDTAKIIFTKCFENPAWGQVITVNGEEGFTYPELIRRIGKYLNKKHLLFPIPKPIMYLIKFLGRVSGLKFGIVPDQIDRFYAPKPVGDLDYPFTRIDDYILQKIKETR